MQQIRSIVAIDDNAKFRSDVQLDLFGDAQENEALLRDYLFSVVAPGRSGVKSALDVSPVDLLNQLVETYSSGSENRFVTIANYGHGKSHLALVLANYFSKPAESPEIKQILDKLDHALNNPALHSRYVDFKRNRGEFLVIRLRGDTPLNVREQFLPKLEQALREHTATANTQVPSWHSYAEQVLTSLSVDEIDRANAALQNDRYDVPALIIAVKQRRDVRDLVVKALTAAKNMAPNLDAELDLGKTMEWLADELCGQGKPLAGALVLFDEFSMYVSRYAQRNVIGELQNLLNGISNRPGKLLFLAFAQQDPNTVAETANVSEATRSSIKHELTRIPKRLALKTLLESVIDAYLRQRDTQWAEFVQDRKIEGALSRATNVAYHAFNDRYVEQLRWDHQRFTATVTRGSFPLSPLTTALLCNLKFSAADAIGDPRTVLGFVMDNLQAKREQTAVVNGAPNWILPVALVDYFENRIAPQLFVGYQNARRKLRPEAGEAERDMLKALYLYDAAQLNLRKDDQFAFLAEATGLTYEQTTDILRSLHEDSVIRQDSTKRVYSLWPANVDPFKLDQLLRKKLEDAQFDNALLSRFNERLGSQFMYGPLAIDVDWGHPDDWVTQSMVLTREAFGEQMLRMLLPRFEVRAGKLEDGVRGMVVWLAARTEDDIRWFQEEAPKVVDQLTSTTPAVPLVVMIPSQATPDLFTAYQRHVVLEQMSQNERTAVGNTIYDHEAQQALRLLMGELKNLIGELGNYRNTPRSSRLIVVPLQYRSAIGAITQPTLKTVLQELYRQAYCYAPREFFRTYRVSTSGSNKLRDAIKQVSNVMLRAKMSTLSDTISTNAVARDLCKLLQGPKWGLLSSRNQLQEPTDSRILAAWKMLDDALEVGARETPVRKPLLSLLNPLYGYDYNTLTLLFSAWIGYHLNDIDLKINNRNAQINDLASALERGPRDFIASVCVGAPATLSRRDPGEGWRRAQSIIQQVQPGTMTVKQATDAISVLTSFAEDSRGNPSQRDQAEAAAQQLQGWLKDARKYEEDVRKISQIASNSERYAIVLDTMSSLVELPRPALVLSAPTVGELQQALQDRLTRVIRLECNSRITPTKQEEVTLSRRDLQRMRATLDQTNQAPLVALVDEAIEKLNEAGELLERQQDEIRLLKELSAMSPDGALPYLLDMRKRLEQVNGLSSRVTQLREQKLQLLNQKIGQLEHVGDNLKSHVDELSSRIEVQQYRDNLLQLTAQYANTSYEASVELALQRTAKLLEFFHAVNDVTGRPIRESNDEQQALQALVALQNKYDGALGRAQMETLAKAQAGIERITDELRRAASEWLQTCKAEFERGGNVNALAAKLAKPPAFLSTAEREELAGLQAKVQERIDSDAVLQVEQLFRRIVNRAQQEQCVAHLQRILEETAPADTWYRQKA